MAGKTKEMSDIRKILQLHQKGYSNRSIAKVAECSKNTVNTYIQALDDLHPDIRKLLAKEDPELERLFHQGNPAYTDARMDVFLQELPYYREQLGKKHVTRQLLWEEYMTSHPDGYQKSQFYYHLKQNLVAGKGATAVLSFTYEPGINLFVDFAGDKLHYVDPDTGEIVRVEVFVACLPYSDYEYALCVPSQKLEDFVHSIRMCFEYIGGVPKIVVSDNLKAAVIRASKTDPTLNQAFEDMGSFYGFVPLPCQPYSPTQKALVESAVRRIYQRIYAKLRDRTFFSIIELNNAIEELLRKHNQTRMQKRPYSREERFFSNEKDTLQPLPEGEYEIKYYCHPKVQYNNFVEVGPDKRNYSVPWKYIGRKADVVYTRSIVKIFIDGNLVATHARSYTDYYIFDKNHIASENAAIMFRSPDDFYERAMRVSATCEKYVRSMFDPARMSCPVEVYYKTCNGILALRNKADIDMYDKACEICTENGIYTTKRFDKVLRSVIRLPSEVQAKETVSPVPTAHENMRGPHKYI